MDVFPTSGVRMAIQDNDLFSINRGGTPQDGDSGSYLVETAPNARDYFDKAPLLFPLASQYLLDPNEFNGWGAIGVYDNVNTQDLGNVGTANPSRIAGGICFPFDITVKRFYAWHYNSNAAAQAWGWRLGVQTKNAGSNAVSWDDIINEVGDNGGTGPRNYSNTTTQNTDIILNTPTVIPAGNVLVLGVESPTAVGTNYYVRILSGYIEAERVY